MYSLRRQEGAQDMSSCLVWTRDPPLHYLHAELAAARGDHAVLAQPALVGIWEPTVSKFADCGHSWK